MIKIEDAVNKVDESFKIQKDFKRLRKGDILQEYMSGTTPRLKKQNRTKKTHPQNKRKNKANHGFTTRCIKLN